MKIVTPIATMAQPTAARSRSWIARATYEPIPGSATWRLPTEIASEATTKNQPPDIDIMVFHMRPGMAKGTSTRQKRCQPENRKPRLASSRSLGIVRNAWKKLNAIFQAWLVKIAKSRQAPLRIVCWGTTRQKTRR
jgi:hypothetical protein